MMETTLMAEPVEVPPARPRTRGERCAEMGLLVPSPDGLYPATRGARLLATHGTVEVVARMVPNKHLAALSASPALVAACEGGAALLARLLAAGVVPMPELLDALRACEAAANLAREITPDDPRWRAGVG